MINKIDIKVSQLLADLESGRTWLKRDNLGYGSIEEKYSANENQITIIRKHPLLANAETTATVINIIDDVTKIENHDNGSTPIGNQQPEAEDKKEDNTKDPSETRINAKFNLDKADAKAIEESSDAFNNI